MALSGRDRYLFDTLGFVVLHDVLTPDELACVNLGIDERKYADFLERTNTLRNSSLGSSGRRDCGNFLSWPQSHGGDVFRSLLAHPKLIPVLNELCGAGHRLDHKPVLFIQQNGAEGFDLHGGAVRSTGEYDFPIAYHVHSGQIVCNLINVAVQLTDSPRGAGGFVVVPGSHKANFPYPQSKSELQHIADTYGYQPECKAGDVVLFTEAVLHGAAVRNAENERRVALIRFSPATCAYARGYLNDHSEFCPYLTPAQRAVIAPPYHFDQDRPVPDPSSGGTTIPRPRRADKKEFDKIVFNHEYY
jgi:ectoine hydroxylase-related dioxygenase (phytanoyl-CoA dioxygenase family)